MTDFQNEQWVSLFQSAIEELEHAQMTGRIQDATTAIVTRIETLRHLPGLHLPEQMAIDDALRTLRFLEYEEQRYQDQAEERRKVVLEHALEKLRSVKPAIERLNDRATDLL